MPGVELFVGGSSHLPRIPVACMWRNQGSCLAVFFWTGRTREKLFQLGIQLFGIAWIELSGKNCPAIILIAFPLIGDLLRENLMSGKQQQNRGINNKQILTLHNHSIDG